MKVLFKLVGIGKTFGLKDRCFLNIYICFSGEVCAFLFIVIPTLTISERFFNSKDGQTRGVILQGRVAAIQALFIASRTF